MKPRIGVIGRDGEISAEIQKIAERIGEDIGRSGAILICGGKGGVMEAACMGAKAAGGLTIGILPSSEGKEANRFVDVPIMSGIGHARNAMVVSSSDAVIAINGREGTLSEICFALTFGRPLVLVEGSGGVADSAAEKLREMGIEKRVHSAKPEDAVKLALSLISESA